MDNEFTKHDAVSLKEHLESKITSLEDKMSVIMQLHQTAISKAEQTMNVRLENMNEFRAQMKDTASTYLTRAEFQQYVNGQDNRISIMNEKIKTFELDRATMSGKASITSLILPTAIAILSLALSLVKLFIH